MPNLSLKDIVDVIVSVSPTATVRNGFNLGLIIGKSNIITPDERVKVYSGLEEMNSDGWLGTEPEYLAAQIYFSQNPKPGKVAIGVWDEENAETAVQAVTACREKNKDWYACTVLDAVKAEIIAVAAYIESASPASAFFYTTSDAEVVAGTANNVMDTLKTALRRRTIGQYSTVDYAAVSIMGYAMGANTGLRNSAYTLAYKSEPGIDPGDLTTQQVATIKGYNGNVYINRGSKYNMFEQGTMADGTPFDEVLNLDMLADEIQKAVMDTLTSLPKVPQTDGGVNSLINAIAEPCENALNKGFIAPGVWKAAPILNLNTGDTLSKGYLILAESVAEQSQADREARKAPPIYVPIKLAGAIEHAVINILVNR